MAESHETYEEPPKEIDVEAKATYDEGYMALMRSPCRPEHDGYFGSTSRQPIEIQYGFQMETTPLAHIQGILEVVEDFVVDEVLVNIFPHMCGYRRRDEVTEAEDLDAMKQRHNDADHHSHRRLGRATGFWFESIAEEVECKFDIAHSDALHIMKVLECPK